MSQRRDPRWWRSGVVYEIYVRSFQDSDGDGVGDLPGVRGRLDHLSWLGVDAIWLSPIMPSPNADFGYDVADYCAVHSELGTLEDLDRLVADAERAGIRVLLDLVANHTSDQHPWFRDARSSRTAAHRDWYVWVDAPERAGPPNNWIDSTGHPAWTFDRVTGSWYLHRFLPQQPDLNWWEPAVREAFDDVLRFWLDRGVAGFRIDVANGIVKDRQLRDDPAVEELDPARPWRFLDPTELRTGLGRVYSGNRPEVHEVLRRWRSVLDGYQPPRALLGETWVFDLRALAAYYGDGETELQLALNLPFEFSEFSAPALAPVIEQTMAALPPTASPVWSGSSHDVSRLATRWARGDRRAVRAALLLLLALPGAAVLYYGDELGLPDTPIPPEAVRDGFALTAGQPALSRDPERAPMPWTPGPNAGFTAPGVEPWLPAADDPDRSVARQRADRGSVLWLCRELMALRRRWDDLRSGVFELLSTGPQALVWRRGTGTVVAVNLSDEPAEVPLPAGKVLVSTRSDRPEDPAVRAAGGGRGPAGRPRQLARLEAWEGLVLDAGGRRG